MPGDLTGASVLVAGAGLAGLCAARDLARHGATVTVVEARDRVGGRVLTARDGFSDSQHAEAGGDMIDENHHEIRHLATDLGLSPVRVLRNGFGYARPGTDGKVRIVGRSAARGWARLAEALKIVSHPYRLAERRWDTPIARELARRSVSQWLDDVGADEELRATANGLRGFFLADPEELSILALLDQFATDNEPIPSRMFRIAEGNDQIAVRLAESLGDRLHLRSEVIAISQRGNSVRTSVKSPRQVSQIVTDYVVFAVPATLLRRIPMTPALPPRQHEAISQLGYGRGTKTLLQFPRRVWRQAARPRAFGSPLPIGAVWEANEEQRGPAGILALLAGGSASDATAALVGREGVGGLTRALSWLGVADERVTAWRQFRWEADPWSRGGYAVFGSTFDPSLRSWLSQPCGRLFFAGEHTSIAGQGYMNGAVESGRRAAAEILATHRLGS